MRLLLAALAFTIACGGNQPIYNLPLQWRGVTAAPKPSQGVAWSLRAVPIALGVRDLRQDPYFVGIHEDIGHVVRTRDNVAQYTSSRIADMLLAAGARLNEPATTNVDADLLEYRVDEGGTFKGLVRIRVAVRRDGAVVWTGTYDGTSKRWGKDYSPENFNEALSNALAEATSKLVQDEGFGRALAPPPGT